MSRKVVPLLAFALMAGCGGSGAKQAAATVGSGTTGTTPGGPRAAASTTPPASGAPATRGVPNGSNPTGGAVVPSAPSSAATPQTGSAGGTSPAAGPAVPSAAPGVYSGDGDGVVTVARSIAGDTALAHIVSRRPQALHVEALNIGGTTVLVDTAATYEGVRAFNSSGGDTTLSVRASGPWTITVTPATSARRFTSVARGTGDDVLLYAGPGSQARITGGGPGRHFRVDANADRIVDSSASYARTLPISLSDGRVLFEVQASGPWTIAMS